MADRITYAQKVDTHSVTDRTKQASAADFTEIKAVVNDHADELENKTTVFAYLSTPLSITMPVKDTWYLLAGTYTNTIVNSFSAGVTGIVFDGLTTTDFTAKYMIGGTASTSCVIRIALAKNAIFSGTELTSPIIPGSGGQDEAISIAGGYLEVNPDGYCGVELGNGDQVTIVISANEDNVVMTPTGGNAMIHRFQ